MNIAAERLYNQRLNHHTFTSPEQAVAWFGGVQSQDYTGAKWALGQRVAGATDASLDDAFNAGRILRTHVLRPTWHFVTPQDIRWMLKLSEPKVNAQSAYYYRQIGLTEPLLRQSQEALVKQLQGNKTLTRLEIPKALMAAGFKTINLALQLNYILMYAELTGVICSGPKKGKQHTYVLLDERAPKGPEFTRDQAIAELTKRYFTSHGPAQMQDFAWWASLTLADVKAGLQANKDHLDFITLDGKTFWFAPGKATPAMQSPVIHLLPNYDEYLVGYRDHTATYDGDMFKKYRPTNFTSVLMNHVVTLDGYVVGGWRRTLSKPRDMELTLFAPLTSAQQRAFNIALDIFNTFLGYEVKPTFATVTK